MSAVRHFVGLDLGPMHEYTAVAVLERARLFPDTGRRDRRPPYALRHLRRFPPGTGYPAVAGEVRTLLRTPPMPGAVLGVDQTGVGRAVMELFHDELWNRVLCLFAPVTVIGSGAPPGAVVGLQVPKLELVGTLQVLLQTRRLQIADALPEAAVLVRELEAFRAAPPVLRGESVESWREREHDDLVLAVAVAAWLGELAAVTECEG